MTADARKCLIYTIRDGEQQVCCMRERIESRAAHIACLQKEVGIACNVQVYSRHQNNNFIVNEADVDERINENGYMRYELTASGDENVLSGELGRATSTDQNPSLKQKLDEIAADLEAVRDEVKLTDYDILHMQKKRNRQDKHKYLRRLRKVNIKRRIEQYENL